jgi:hypothetical protein
VRSVEQIARVGVLVEAGANDCEIARRTGIPRRTISDWRRARRWETWTETRSCQSCGSPEHRFSDLPKEYVYLLGLYLGDGYIVHSRRGVYRLVVAMDDAYPQIVAECRAAIASVVPGAPAYLQRRPDSRCVWVVKYSKRWPCLFPQHGPGPKHRRRIRLRPWQQGLVERHASQFVRGLLHSDGSRFSNTVRVGGRVYSYPRYAFTNASADIRRLFCTACDLLDIEWRVMNPRNISVARRESVRRLDEFVGPKR